MSVRKTKYALMVNLSIVDGSFNSINDLMDYIRYRLNLRGRSTDSILMDDIVLLSETKVNDQVEMKI